MDRAQTLFREGVIALRERKNAAEARRLLLELLRLNPQNDMAWVWMARALGDPARRRECLQRALKINPANEQARTLLEALDAPPPAPEAAEAAIPVTAPAVKPPKVDSAQMRRQIAVHLKKAEHYVDGGDPEQAIAEWVAVLKLQPDHEEALRQAVGYLSRMKYIDDARELVWRAIDSGTDHPSVYLTAIDIARHQGDSVEADQLRERLVKLPSVDDETIVRTADYFVDNQEVIRARELLEQALQRRPGSQRIMTALGDLHKDLNEDIEAMRYYDRAARIGAGTKAGREADKKLADFAPVLTDRERGSALLAGREALGFGLIFLFLAWQDAGLDLLQLGGLRWLGVLLSIVGGYLLVTATSSPQQKPVARWLGGYVPDFSGRNKDAKKGLIIDDTQLPIIPPAMRLTLGVMGTALLAVAVALTFSTALHLLTNPVWPEGLPTFEDLILPTSGG